MSNELAILPQFTAVAVNATEMKAASENIRIWLEAKCESLDTIVAESHAALDAATRNGWRTSALEGVFRREKQRQLYYGKLLEAVRAGYTIVPNMDVDVFAIRVKREKPAVPGDVAISKYSYWTPSIPDEEEQRLPVGEGRYESPTQRVSKQDSNAQNKKGETVFTRSIVPVGFADLEFPLAIANAQVMDATAHAMSLKLFDRIGIVPSTATHGDPIVLGQITYNRRSQRKTASFLIAWYLDPRKL